MSQENATDTVNNEIPTFPSRTTIPQPIKLSAEVNLVAQKEDLSKEVIQYLSKEIETTANNMSVFRSKISLAIFLGPFLLLGSVVIGAKGLTISANFDLGFWICVAIDCGCYLSLAYMASRIEQQAGEQCNEWRELIAEIYQNPLIDIKSPQKNPMLGGGRGSKLHNIYRSRPAYLISYGLMLVSFTMSIVIVGKLRVVDSPAMNSPRVESSAPVGTDSNIKKPE